ncbi:hypothetical protein [Streptomyces sp. NPDC004528]|uniref:hypothetical protein n=1 Tax=Streptomyces sp. NPDC004528 TaxID=3154550 RepID=UPI00339EF43F
MDSTHTARRRRPEEGSAGRPPAESAAAHQAQPPIYAQLVAEWRAKGRTVPGNREVFEVLWATFAAPDPLGSELWPAVSRADRRPAGPQPRPSAIRTERSSRETDPAPGGGASDAGGEAEAAVEVKAEHVPAVPVPRGLPVD